MGASTMTALRARYVPGRLLPGLLLAVVLTAAGVLTALAGVVMGWILAAFMLWSAANAISKMRRRDPVITVDETGVTDHRLPRHIPWQNVASMRTVDRRVVLVKVPLLELVPHEPLTRDGKAMLGAVVRGDIAFVDARDDDRVMVDLRYLDVTPEEVLAAARALRGSVHAHGQ
jgi:hypothetical protein